MANLLLHSIYGILPVVAVHHEVTVALAAQSCILSFSSWSASLNRRRRVQEMPPYVVIRLIRVALIRQAQVAVSW
jgi:hypothetical protein